MTVAKREDYRDRIIRIPVKVIGNQLAIAKILAKRGNICLI